MKPNTYRNLSSICMVSLVALSVVNLICKFTKKNETKKKPLNRKIKLPSARTQIRKPREFEGIPIDDSDGLVIKKL